MKLWAPRNQGILGSGKRGIDTGEKAVKMSGRDLNYFQSFWTCFGLDFWTVFS